MVALCFSTFLSFGQMPRKVGHRQGQRSGTGGSSMAHGSLLRNNAETFKKAASGSPTTGRLKTVPAMGSRKETSSEGSQVGFSTFVHHLLCAKKVPTKVAKYIAKNSWNKGVITKMNTATRWWIEFCKVERKPVIGFSLRQSLAYLDCCVNELHLTFYAIRASKEFLFAVSRLLIKPFPDLDKECITKYI